MRNTVIAVALPLLCAFGILPGLLSCSHSLPNLPPLERTECSSTTKPLLVDWGGLDRAELETRATRGIVVVRYTDCRMEILGNCRTTGAYTYQSVSWKQDVVTITSLKELYSYLPIGAAALQGQLTASGEINVDMVIVGRKEAANTEITERDLSGHCEGATHIISGLTIGHFRIFNGNSVEVDISGRLGQHQSGARWTSSQERRTQDGKADACDKHMDDASTPPLGCGGLLRAEVIPIGIHTYTTEGFTGPQIQPLESPHQTCSREALNCTDVIIPEHRTLIELNNAAMRARKNELDPRRGICLASRVAGRADSGIVISISNYEMARGWEALNCLDLASEHIERALNTRRPSDPGWGEVCKTCQRIGRSTCEGCI